MKIHNITRATLLFSSAVLLAACGGGGGHHAGEGASTPDSSAQSLAYSYPGNNQYEVAPPAPVVLRFTSSVSLSNATSAITLHENGANGTAVPYSAKLSPDNQGVILTPDDKLKPNTEYTVTIQGLTLAGGNAANQNVVFHTAALDRGPQSLQEESDSFTLQRHYPNDSTVQPVMDFSTFRLQFSQPIDAQTAHYGTAPASSTSPADTVALKDSQGNLVPASLIVDGPYMTIDPIQDYLTAGEKYTLTISTGLASTFGDALQSSDKISFTPDKSSPSGNPSILVQKITESNGGSVVSPLTGMALNVIPVNGTLLGKDVNTTQAHADIYAELADIVTYPNVTAFRIPKGTVLNGDSINIMIGGAVPAGFESGDVKMVLLSDATGYLEPNSYTDNANAKKHMHLFMDVGIATADARANGAFTQNLLHIELVGTAQVSDGKMDINAVGVVQPDILGQETGYGILSFQLKSYEDQSGHAQVADVTPPTLQSWMPGDNADLQKPGDPIIFNFDEPLDPESVAGQVHLYHNGIEVPQDDLDVSVDGAAVVIKAKPEIEKNQYGSTARYPQMLDYNNIDLSNPSVQGNQYQVQIGGGLTDIVGNAVTPIDKQFSLTDSIDVYNIEDFAPAGTDSYILERRKGPYAPIILASYPGFPCALQQEFVNEQGPGSFAPVRDLAKNQAGRCAGGPASITDGTAWDQHWVADDIIPVKSIPPEHSIIVAFSTEIMPSSVVLGKTFKVDMIDDNQNILEGDIPGKLKIGSSQIEFTPNSPWKKGKLYRYTILSDGYKVERADVLDTPLNSLLSDKTYTCGDTAVCGSNGLPIQTQPIGLTAIHKIDSAPAGSDYDSDYTVIPTGPDMDAGGPDFVQFFRGGENSDSVVQFLTTKPISDVNRNYHVERSNIGTSLALEGMPAIPSANEYELPVEEYGPTDHLSPDSDGYPYDPDGSDGYVPPRNSAKVLSEYRIPEIESQMDAQSPPRTMLGLNTGCGYVYPYPPTPPLSPVGPMVCPEHKFTYLNSAMVAEVTDNVTQDGIEVKIWPSMVIGTSIKTVALQNVAAAAGLGPWPGETGKQMLRMRYTGADRDNPIIGHIEESSEGPVLTAQVDLYLDAPYAAELGLGAKPNGINLRSYQISMDLEGKVHFLNDGRMVVEQYNTNRVDIDMRYHGSQGNWAGYGALFIPEYGSRLNFVTSPIK